MRRFRAIPFVFGLFFGISGTLSVVLTRLVGHARCSCPPVSKLCPVRDESHAPSPQEKVSNTAKLPQSTSTTLVKEESSLQARASLSRKLDDMVAPPWRPFLLSPPQPRSSLKTLTIILVALNEHEFLEPTLSSIMETTAGVDVAGTELKEIILVDDASDPPMSTAVNVEAARGLLRIIRLEKHHGLMMARVMGARNATGDVLVFFDCHVKPLAGWFPPLLGHLKSNYRRVVTPSIPVLSEEWEVDAGSNTVGQVFQEWNLNTMLWINSPNNWVMVPAGGLFAVTRAWWFESGEYDIGMRGWGMEQLEQALRMWLCGGEIVVERSSSVGHYYRKTGKVNDGGVSLMQNKIRVVETWFDEYKDQFYLSHPEARNKRSEVAKDLTERNSLRRKLGCRPFSAFIQSFRPYFLVFNLIADDGAYKHGLCRWNRYAGKYLGIYAGLWPDLSAHEFSLAELNGDQEQAELKAKRQCEDMGAICSGVTCSAQACSARRGTPFLKDSPEHEVSHLKICCQYERIKGMFLGEVAYVSPVMPYKDMNFRRADLDVAFQRCEALTELCVGVTCNEEFCQPRAGRRGLEPSPTGEVTYVKKCS